MNFNEKQLQIVKIAEELFASRGFEGTSVRDIAEAAGINIAMISYYFGSKEKLMEALFDVRISDIKMKVESLLEDTTLSYAEKVDQLIVAHINRVIENTRFYKIMVTEQLIDKNGVLAEKVKQIKKRNNEVIGQLIEKGVQAGEFRPCDDVPLLMNTLIGTVNHTMLGEEFYRDYHGLKDMNDQEFKELIKTRLSKHISNIFKTILLK